MPELKADLVLEGGGVKGIGLVGAVVALTQAGYQVQRVSGTSAGAITGALVAAGLRGEALRHTALELDYSQFRDAGHLERLPLVGPQLALLTGTGLYRGDYALHWLQRTLAGLGVRTFGDLRIDDPELPPDRRYRLVVTATDVTRGEMVRLPWDYERLYGLDPDRQSVAEAVRASMSIPFFFRPVQITDRSSGTTSTLVDGGLLSNFPIDSLDREDGRPPRWPTFGIKIMPNLPQERTKLPLLLQLATPPVVELLAAVVDTTLVGKDQALLDHPWVQARTIAVDTEAVSVTDFGISRERARGLYANGFDAATRFLSSWDWAAYRRRFRGVGRARRPARTTSPATPGR